MSPTAYHLLAIVCVAGMVWSIRWMNSPRTAVRGNLLGSASVLGGILLTLGFHGLLSHGLLWAAMGAGAAAGWWLALKTVLLRIPQLVGLLNGLGGVASALAAIVVLRTAPESLDIAERLTAALALAVGTVTFSGSAVAAAKLDRKMPQRPMVLRAHTQLATASMFALALLVVLIAAGRSGWVDWLSVAASIVGLGAGTILAVRVGGADMPVTISLLNSLSGVAGALAGFAVGDPILVAAGGIVGTAGLILTSIMCRAANRSLLRILLGQAGVVKKMLGEKTVAGGEKGSPPEAPPAGGLKPVAAPAAAPESAESSADRLARIVGLLKDSKIVVVVPGYGMALAEAQGEVKRLLDSLEGLGKDVRCAIHPLAGRMPGHMHVLLAEADVPYEKLFDMEKLNDKFREVDAVVVVGANDVVNSGANTAVKTPIYGMPVLRVEEARWVIVCNQDTQPGYSGVPNPLYRAQNAILFLGDAGASLRQIVEALGAA